MSSRMAADLRKPRCISARAEVHAQQSSSVTSSIFAGPHESTPLPMPQPAIVQSLNLTPSQGLGRRKFGSLAGSTLLPCSKPSSSAIAVSSSLSVGSSVFSSSVRVPGTGLLAPSNRLACSPLPQKTNPEQTLAGRKATCQLLVALTCLSL